MFTFLNILMNNPESNKHFEYCDERHHILRLYYDLILVKYFFLSLFRSDRLCDKSTIKKCLSSEVIIYNILYIIYIIYY